jgi:hypothetical protein
MVAPACLSEQRHRSIAHLRGCLKLLDKSIIILEFFQPGIDICDTFLFFLEFEILVVLDLPPIFDQVDLTNRNQLAVV